MARTPSLTPDTAVALIGPRGATPVNSANRGDVKRWLVASGVPSGFVGTLALSVLDRVYNDVSDFALRALAAEAESYVASAGVPAGVPIGVIATPDVPAVETAPAAAGTPLQRLQEALNAVVQGNLDETKVRAIVRDEIADMTPTLRIEVKDASGTVRATGDKQHYLFPELLERLSRRCNVALYGPAGSGKTSAAETAAKLLGHAFYISGAFTGAHELLGYINMQGVYQTTPFRQAFEHGGTWCADEIDASVDPAAVMALQAALSTGYCTFPDSPLPVKRHADFVAIACLNTTGLGADSTYSSRVQLDGAFRDRFRFIEWGYDESFERSLAGNDAWVDFVQAVRRAAKAQGVGLLVTPRASIMGAQDLAAGVARERVEAELIWRGTDSDTVAAVRRAAMTALAQ